MKQFVGMNANLRFDVHEDGLVEGQAEVIVMVSESVYYLGDTRLHRERPSQVEALRFHVNTSGVKGMIEGLQKLQAELQDLEERVVVEPKRIIDDEENNGC